MEESPLTSFAGDSRETCLLTTAATFVADSPASKSEVVRAGMAFNFNRQLWLSQTFLCSMSRDCCCKRGLGVSECLGRSVHARVGKGQAPKEVILYGKAAFD